MAVVINAMIVWTATRKRARHFLQRRSVTVPGKTGDTTHMLNCFTFAGQTWLQSSLQTGAVDRVSYPVRQGTMDTRSERILRIAFASVISVVDHAAPAFVEA